MNGRYIQIFDITKNLYEVLIDSNGRPVVFKDFDAAHEATKELMHKGYTVAISTCYNINQVNTGAEIHIPIAVSV